MTCAEPTVRILVTGPPGIGKTTLARAVADRVPGLRAVGFFTEEVRGRGGRVGFDLVGLPDGPRAVLARQGLKSPFRVGAYGVDVEGFEAFLETVDWHRSAGGLFVVDEIGKMECLSPVFRERMERLLAGPAPVLATVARKGGGLVARVKARPDVRLLTVSRENRDRLAGEVCGLLLPFLPHR